MGVPAFFRWLSRKYPSVVHNCVEDRQQDVEGVSVPIDTTQPNPNGIEFDNLYLDMNGIVHPCCHPEDRPAPKTEDEMMVLIFEYIDRLFAIVRPRRLLYMAIDGVAPRAKMNQQRSRRFRASKDSRDKRTEIQKQRDLLESQGYPLPPPRADEEHFDSNCITPGTPFMANLAECLRYYVHDRLNCDPGWKNIQVILSDASVPGEGEHKIMDYIRRQRGSPSHDPNTVHCLCGADADLIMLGLATHEANFTIIREEFIPHQQKPCDLCGQYGHDLKDCQGLAKEKSGDYGEVATPVQKVKNFIFLRLNTLREYLEKELFMDNLPFPFDLERAIDDWVFMCFFVGNDFLPHLPSLEIREGAIDRLIRLYKQTVYKTGGYLTDSGKVHLSRVQLILTELGEAEDLIFQERQAKELQFRRRDKERKKRMRGATAPSYIPANQFAPVPIGQKPNPAWNARQTAFEMRTRNFSTDSANQSAAQSLKAMLRPAEGGEESHLDGRGQKRKWDEGKEEKEEEEDEGPQDDVRLYEAGWKERYYQAKFEVTADDLMFRYAVARCYVEGLCWVLRYYYQGCASWKWFFPYHYAPFASDFANIGNLKIDFDPDTKPFRPLEQLMGVFPEASKMHIPVAWRPLMFEPESEIIDFYPEDFQVDLNGKKMAWQGVSLLPFVEEGRLLSTLESVYCLLTAEEADRNIRGWDRVFVGEKHKAFKFMQAVYANFDGDKDEVKEGADIELIELEPSLAYGMAGKIAVAPNSFLPAETVLSPVAGCPDLPANKSICVLYRDPQFPNQHTFLARRLKGAKDPPKELKPGNWDDSQGRYRPMIGMAPGGPRGRLGDAGHRMLGHQGVGKYSNVPPPQTGNYYGGYNNERHHRSYSDRGGYGRGGGGPGYNSQPRGYNAGYNAPPRGYGGHWQQAQMHQGQAYAQNLQRYRPPYRPGEYGGNQQRYSQHQEHRQQHRGGYKRPGASDYF